MGCWPKLIACIYKTPKGWLLVVNVDKLILQKEFDKYVVVWYTVNYYLVSVQLLSEVDLDDNTMFVIRNI